MRCLTTFALLNLMLRRFIRVEEYCLLSELSDLFSIRCHKLRLLVGAPAYFVTLILIQPSLTSLTSLEFRLRLLKRLCSDMCADFFIFILLCFLMTYRHCSLLKYAPCVKFIIIFTQFLHCASFTFIQSPASTIRAQCNDVSFFAPQFQHSLMS